MLPELPSIAHGQFPILQQWFGIASLLLVVFGIYVSIRKMNRDDRASQRSSAVENPLANMPKYYMEGPIVRAFEMMEEIIDRLKRIENKIDDWTEPEDNHRRRR